MIVPSALTYWGIGGTDPDAYQQAVESDRVTQDVAVNHSPQFAPALTPACRVGTQAMVVAALSWLAGPADESSTAAVG